VAGLAADEVAVPLGGRRSLAAALYRPDTPGEHPGVLVLHEAFGLNEDIRRIARRWAEEGYVAMAPDLYSVGARLACLARVLVDSACFADSPTLSRIEAARAWLADRPEVAADRVGVVGYCQGGGFALALATRGRVGVAGVNYGAVPRRASQLEGICPVVASYGGADRLFAGHARRLASHLSSLGVPHDVKVYEGVGHSFMSWGNVPAWLDRLPLPDPMHMGYDERAAEDAWRRTLAFFAEHLGTEN
jgi:carboxymethylenebutenolidase